MAQLERLWRDASSQAEEPKGHLRVAAPSDLFSLIRVELIADFLRDHPAISLELVLSDDQADLIGSGIDIALRAGTVVDEDLVARQLGTSRLIVVAGPQCLAEHGVPQTPAALSKFPCLASRGKNGRTTWPLLGPNGKAPVEVHTRLTVNGMGALIIAAKGGLGAALVPEELAHDGLASGELVHVMKRYHFDSAGVFAVYPNRKHPTAALRAFLDFIVAHAESRKASP
jgi:DNA-binding transcriptional LysR family regulator